MARDPSGGGSGARSRPVVGAGGPIDPQVDGSVVERLVRGPGRVVVTRFEPIGVERHAVVVLEDDVPPVEAVLAAVRRHIAVGPALVGLVAEQVGASPQSMQRMTGSTWITVDARGWTWCERTGARRRRGYGELLCASSPVRPAAVRCSLPLDGTPGPPPTGCVRRCSTCSRASTRSRGPRCSTCSRVPALSASRRCRVARPRRLRRARRRCPPCAPGQPGRHRPGRPGPGARRHSRVLPGRAGPGPFDLVLLDPPYAYDQWETLLAGLTARLVVVESDRGAWLPVGSCPHEVVRQYARRARSCGGVRGLTPSVTSRLSHPTLPPESTWPRSSTRGRSIQAIRN